MENTQTVNENFEAQMLAKAKMDWTWSVERAKSALVKGYGNPTVVEEEEAKTFTTVEEYYESYKRMEENKKVVQDRKYSKELSLVKEAFNNMIEGPHGKLPVDVFFNPDTQAHLVHSINQIIWHITTDNDDCKSLREQAGWMFDTPEFKEFENNNDAKELQVILDTIYNAYEEVMKVQLPELKVETVKDFVYGITDLFKVIGICAGRRSSLPTALKPVKDTKYTRLLELNRYLNSKVRIPGALNKVEAWKGPRPYEGDTVESFVNTIQYEVNEQGLEPSLMGWFERKLEEGYTGAHIRRTNVEELREQYKLIQESFKEVLSIELADEVINSATDFLIAYYRIANYEGSLEPLAS